MDVYKPVKWISCVGVFSMLHFFPAASAQFIKHIDNQGHVTYGDDPAYDYAADEPSAENREINRNQLRQLREFIDYRARLPKPEPRAPKMTVRTGRAVCLRSLSLSNLKLGCK